MLQSGDQVGTKEMSEGKQLSPPPETLLALFNLRLYGFNLGGTRPLEMTRNHPNLRTVFSRFPSNDFTLIKFSRQEGVMSEHELMQRMMDLS